MNVTEVECYQVSYILCLVINKNVVDDLDAIYFFDKVNMRANSASHKKIPKLDLNFVQEKMKAPEVHNIKKIPVPILVNLGFET